MPQFEQKFQSLNSEVFLCLRTPSEVIAKRFFADLNSLIRQFEQDFSRFLPDSQLSILNKNAGKKVQASPELINIIKKAKEMAVNSDGLYNPFVLPALQKAGYVGSWPKPEQNISDLNFSARSIVSANKIDIGDNPHRHLVGGGEGWIKIPANSALDFGGIGKGYLLDQLADFADKNGIDDFWFSLGGDIIVNGNDDRRVGWGVAIANLDSDEPLSEKIITTGEKTAIATSGIIKRKGIKDNKPWHHIIDPRTGKPAKTDILTATVVADTATEADIWAKSIVILGSIEAKNFIAKKKIKKAIIQKND